MITTVGARRLGFEVEPTDGGVGGVRFVMLHGLACMSTYLAKAIGQVRHRGAPFDVSERTRLALGRGKPRIGKELTCI